MTRKELKINFLSGILIILVDKIFGSLKYLPDNHDGLMHIPSEINSIYLQSRARDLVTQPWVICNMTKSLPALTSLNPGPWNCSQAKKEPGSWCNWKGISCQPNSNKGPVVIYSIDLGSNQLVGKLPSSIGLLTTLDTLLIDNNFISGTIPSQLGDMSSITALKLDHNSFTGTLPNYLTNLTTLVVFDISFNYLTGTLNPYFSNNTYLSETAPDHTNFIMSTRKPTEQPVKFKPCKYLYF